MSIDDPASLTKANSEVALARSPEPLPRGPWSVCLSARMPPKKRKVDLNANARQDKKEGTSRTSFTEDTKRESSSGQRQDEGGDGDGAGSSAEAPSELLRLDILGALIQRRCDHIVINILNNLVRLVFT